LFGACTQEASGDVQRTNSAKGSNVTTVEALRKVVEAWEALPEGHYSPREVERWMHRHMKPAIDAARAALSTTKPTPHRGAT